MSVDAARAPQAEAIRQLQELARTDPSVAPLARLQVAALQAADGTWETGLPAFEDHRLADGLPLLHGRTLHVDAGRLRALLAQLTDIAAGAGQQDPERLRRSLEAGVPDPLALLEASIRQDAERLEALAVESEVEPGLLATLAGLAALPLLQACGRKAAPLLQDLAWDMGFCPVCAAWAALAELRGLERRRWLRCGRCGAGWELPGMRCAFCANDDFRSLGYLAPESAREARQAATCDRCFGYLKTFTTLGPLAPAAIAVHDLTSLELDMAALEAEYGRPDTAGFPLALHIEPSPVNSAEDKRRGGWLRRR